MKTLLEFTRVQKQDDKEISREFAILKPTQSLKEEAEEFNAIEQSKLVRRGVLTRQMLRKRLLGDGEIYSESEKKSIQNLYDDHEKFNIELRDVLTEETKDDSTTKRVEELKEKLAQLRTEIQAFEMSQIALFDSTAEVIARNRTLFWWTLVLLLEKKKDKFSPIFSGREYLNLKEQYDEAVEENPFFTTLFKDVAEIVTLWFLGVINTKEEFKTQWDSKQEPEKEEAKEPVAEVTKELVQEVKQENPVISEA